MTFVQLEELAQQMGYCLVEKGYKCKTETATCKDERWETMNGTKVCNCHLTEELQVALT